MKRLNERRSTYRHHPTRIHHQELGQSQFEPLLQQPLDVVLDVRLCFVSQHWQSSFYPRCWYRCLFVLKMLKTICNTKSRCSEKKLTFDVKHNKCCVCVQRVNKWFCPGVSNEIVFCFEEMKWANTKRCCSSLCSNPTGRAQSALYLLSVLHLMKLLHHLLFRCLLIW